MVFQTLVHKGNLIRTSIWFYFDLRSEYNICLWSEYNFVLKPLEIPYIQCVQVIIKYM